MGITTTITCDKCGITQADVPFQLLIPLTIECGVSTEEGWEWWGRLLCTTCLADLSGPLSALLEALGVPSTHRFGEHDFHTDRNEWEYHTFPALGLT